MHREAAIVGIGQTEISRNSGRTEWELALEAGLAALRDAGVEPKEVDGIVRFSYDNVTEAMLARSLGLHNLRHYSEVGWGGIASCAVVAHAAAAIASGQASVVLVYRSLNVRSGVRYGRAERVLRGNGDVTVAGGPRSMGGELSAPHGLLVPGQGLALGARRYQHQYGIDDGTLTRGLGRIAVQQREYAQANPLAQMRERELTMEGYRAGRMISEPLRIFDYCLESDGAAALVLVDADRAKSLRTDPVFVLSASQSMTPYAEPIAIYKKDIINWGPPDAPKRLFDDAGVKPSDLAFAQLYDSFTPLVLFQLEAYRLAEPGAGWKYVLDHGIALGSRLPINTSGGHLSEGYLHGMNHLAEAVRQFRGTASSQDQRSGPALIGSSMMSAVILDR